MKSALVMVAVVLLGAGCDVGGGKLTGAGGGTLDTGSGGSRIMTGSGGGIVTGSAGAGGFPLNPCGAQYPAERVPPEILIVLDTSASMNDAFDGPCASGCGSNSKWSAAVSAINSVVAAQTQEVNWGLQMITYGGDVCSAAAVTVPVGGDTGIRSALTRATIGGLLAYPGNTPTRAALDIATAHLAARSTIGDHIILLVTDGLPDCGMSATDVLASDAPATVQAITNARTMGIPTVVAGLSIAPAADAALSEMAREGGLARDGSPIYFPVSSSADLVAVMSSIIADTACFFAIPIPPNNDGTVSTGNIGVMIDGAAIPRDANNGWNYRDANMRDIQLTGSACEMARAGGTVTVTFHCLLP